MRRQVYHMIHGWILSELLNTAVLHWQGNVPESVQAALSATCSAVGVVLRLTAPV